MEEEKKNEPGAGGWVPTPLQLWLLTLLAAVLGAAGPVLAAKPLDVQALVSAVVSGLATGLVANLGLRSAGPRSLP